MCFPWTHTHSLPIPCVSPEQTIYLYHVFFLNTQSMHILCSLWTYSLVISLVHQINHSISIPCLHLENTEYLFYVSTLNTQSIFTMNSSLNTQLIYNVFSLVNTCLTYTVCSSWTHSSYIVCVPPEHTIYFIMWSPRTNSLSTPCVPFEHLFILCVQLKNTFFYDMCSPWTHVYPIHVFILHCLSWTHSLSIPCVPIEHTSYPYHVFRFNSVLPYHMFILNIQYIHSEHTAYLYHVFTLNIKSIYAVGSLTNMCGIPQT